MHLVVINDKQKENVQKMQTHKANAPERIPKIWIHSRTWIPHKIMKLCNRERAHIFAKLDLITRSMYS